MLSPESDVINTLIMRKKYLDQILTKPLEKRIKSVTPKDVPINGFPLGNGHFGGCYGEGEKVAD
jgi:hypothetical protein